MAFTTPPYQPPPAGPSTNPDGSPNFANQAQGSLDRTANDNANGDQFAASGDIMPFTANYGGTPGGANQFMAYTDTLGQQAASQAAPQMDMTAANADRAQGLAGLARQGQGLAAMQAAGAGGGPGAQAAQSTFNAGANQNMLTSLQASGAGRGAAGMAAAQGGALAGNATAMNAAAAQAAQSRSASALQGLSGYQQGAQGLSSGIGQLAGNDWAASQSQANLQAQQNAINQAGQLGYLGLGASALEAQNSAGAANYAAQLGNMTGANALAAQQTAQNTALGIGAAQGAASGIGQLAKSGKSNNSNSSGSSSSDDSEGFGGEEGDD